MRAQLASSHQTRVFVRASVERMRERVFCRPFRRNKVRIETSSPLASVISWRMSHNPNDSPTSPNEIGAQKAEGAAAEVVKPATEAPRQAQPFKLPYSNQFDVEFKDVHALKEDRIYSDPVTFGPLKWYEMQVSTNERRIPRCGSSPSVLLQILVYSHYNPLLCTLVSDIFHSQ